jgi:hypothetical protein
LGWSELASKTYHQAQKTGGVAVYADILLVREVASVTEKRTTSATTTVKRFSLKDDKIDTHECIVKFTATSEEEVYYVMQQNVLFLKRNKK